MAQIVGSLNFGMCTDWAGPSVLINMSSKNMDKHIGTNFYSCKTYIDSFIPSLQSPKSGQDSFLPNNTWLEYVPLKVIATGFNNIYRWIIFFRVNLGFSTLSVPPLLLHLLLFSAFTLGVLLLLLVYWRYSSGPGHSLSLPFISC